MTTPAPPSRHVWLVVALAFGFAAAHTQSPLFYQNQNQYLLHGLAAAGYGHLSADWLATTKDPTPVFSLLVAWLYRLGGLFAIQAAYFILLADYFLAAWWLVSALPGVRRSRAGLLAWAALFTAAHAALPRWLSVQLLGADYPWFLQAGVANQYVLGPGLQPSAFGMLLVGALAAFANGRPLVAGLLGSAAAVVHPTYLLPAGLLTAGYMVALFRDGQRGAALGVGAVSLAAVISVIAYALVTFPPSSPEAFTEAQRILADVRIPHHAVVRRWFDGICAVQIAWVVVGIVLARRTRLFWPLLVPAVAAVALTLLQVATGDRTLALLFPWRVSAVLVPVATAVAFARLITAIPDTRAVMWTAAGVFTALVIGGVVMMALGIGYAMNEAEVPTLTYVRDHATAADVYLIPTRIPPVGTGRGTPSTTFTPPPRPKPGSTLIPVDLQRFRLATGARLFVDFKSIPYADVEVLEWYRRMRLVEAWYAASEWDDAVREQLRAEGITHVLIPRDRPIRGTFLGEPLYADEAYAVYRVE